MAAAARRTADIAGVAAPPAVVVSMSEIFAALDMANTGYLSDADLAGVFPGTPLNQMKAAQAYVEKHDSDGDGRLSIAELDAALSATTDEAMAVANGGDNEMARKHLLAIDCDVRGPVAKRDKAAWSASTWCQRLALVVPYLPATRASLGALLAKGPAPSLDAEALAEVKLQMAAEAEREKAAQAAKKAEDEREERSRTAAAAQQAESDRRWASMSNEEREAAMVCMSASEALSRGLTSGVRGSYDCPTDRWGNCTGCREHDI